MKTKVIISGLLAALFAVGAHAATDCADKSPGAQQKGAFAANKNRPPELLNTVICFRVDFESGNLAPECQAIKNQMKGVMFSYIVVPNQARQLEIQRAKVVP